MDTGERLRKLREGRRLSGRAAAQYLGISGAHVSDMESGKSSPSVDMLVRLVAFYRTSADYILGIIDDPAPAATQHRWHPDAEAAAELLQAATAAKRAEMLAVLTVMSIAAKAEEDRVNPLLAKLDEATRMQLERSIQIEGDLTVADVRGLLETLHEQEEQQGTEPGIAGQRQP